ncbi:hypothetical protein [Desulfothermobacter acidiphilus]|uniref:hypothetical protein n=1 Tax=Desulfothermobacter acidiphilus TaxID=1938353 RepID=UPI003F8942B4
MAHYQVIVDGEVLQHLFPRGARQELVGGSGENFSSWKPRRQDSPGTCAIKGSNY